MTASCLQPLVFRQKPARSRRAGLGECDICRSYIWGPLWPLLASRPRNHHRVCLGCCGELEASWLPKPAFHSHHPQENSFVSPAKCYPQEQFPGASDWLLTQILAANFLWWRKPGGSWAEEDSELAQGQAWGLYLPHCQVLRRNGEPLLFGSL